VAGRGGHGAMAGAEGNVVLAVSQLASRLGEVVDGLAFDDVNCACSAGIIHAGTANNVVPRTALLRGSLRTFTAEQLAEASARLGSLLDEVERTFAVRCSLSVTGGTPAVVNDAAVYSSVMASARRVLGEQFVLAMPPTPASDDVSEFLNRVPGCYLFVGGALADGTSGSHHGPDFAVEDGAVPVMAHVLSASAIDLAA
ncbi:MAG: M20/M25/M40 family metallo-hydrolase, partial [Actinomycetales bacterium]|nr:M20/M25/M40 family metallo-hydrolase [Actinomycetales bacterium]